MGFASKKTCSFCPNARSLLGLVGFNEGPFGQAWAINDSTHLDDASGFAGKLRVFRGSENMGSGYADSPS